MQRDIVKGAEVEDAAYDLLEVTKADVARFAAWPVTGQTLNLSWPSKGEDGASRTLRPGDAVNLTIWDSQENSLLTPNEQRSVPMRGLVISPNGTIFVPYIDELKVSGYTPEAARAEIQRRLALIAPSAQVQLDVAQGEQNSIELVSGVAKPGRYPMDASSVSVLSVLAQAGGIPDTMRNPVVRLQRGGKAYAMLAKELYRNPAKDISMRGGDRIAVESDPRSVVVMGASGAEKTVAFEKGSMTLIEALSLSSGLAESRANIHGIMVLRRYPADALRADGTGPAKQQVVFAFDLSSGEGLFAASDFPIYAGDVILATESPVPSITSIIGVFGASLTAAQRANNL